MEAYTAEHTNTTIEELLYEWPATKFEAFYTAFAKRKIADELSLRRSLEMAAVWGNMNYDSKEEPEIRQNLMESIDERFSMAIAKLYDSALSEDEEAEVDEKDPFWQAMERGKEKYQIENG